MPPGKPPARTGRKSGCTPERTESIRADLLLGLTRESAAARAGIGRPTLQRWIADGLAGKAPYVAFLEALDAAEAEAQRRLLGTIVAASQPRRDGKDGSPAPRPGQWQAAAWILERRWPAAWRSRTETESGGEGGEQIHVTFTIPDRKPPPPAS